MLIMLSPATSHAAIWYYSSGNYMSSAPIKPTTGLNFYVDYSAITTYGSGAFTVAFDWNGNYLGNVAAIAQYPASASTFPGYFPISADSTLPLYVRGQTFYYYANGSIIGGTCPMDSTSIYRSSIRLNSNPSVFSNIYGTFNEAYLEKVIRHEIGHVFLLKHPSTLYFSSVMHEGEPSGFISATVTTDDRSNIQAKWGN
jgi:hypothetical protein